MKFTSAIILAVSSLVSAQVTSNSDGSFTCAIPDAAYCAADSLSGNIIIRCIGTVGHPGNCNDNLDGAFPQGLSFAPCWQTSATSGDAACSKNCVVYEGSGSGKQNGTFTLPGCTPTATQTTSAPVSTATASFPIPNNSTTYIQSSSFATLTTTTVGPIGTGTCNVCSGSGNGNGTTPTGTGSQSSATATPKSPSRTSSIPFTGAATANHAGLFLASIGFLCAYFL